MTPSHQPLIAAEGLTRSFGSPRTGDWVEVLRGIDVTIPRGTMLAVVGPSGCGKTSLLYCLSGLDRPDGGRLRGFGADMASMPSSKLAELYRTRIGFVFQSSNLVESLTAEENVLLLARYHHLQPEVLEKAKTRCLIKQPKKHVSFSFSLDDSVSSLPRRLRLSLPLLR